MLFMLISNVGYVEHGARQVLSVVVQAKDSDEARMRARNKYKKQTWLSHQYSRCVVIPEPVRQRCHSVAGIRASSRK